MIFDKPKKKVTVVFRPWPKPLFSYRTTNDTVRREYTQSLFLDFVLANKRPSLVFSLKKNNNKEDYDDEEEEEEEEEEEGKIK